MYSSKGNDTPPPPPPRYSRGTQKCVRGRVLNEPSRKILNKLKYDRSELQIPAFLSASDDVLICPVKFE